MKNYGIKDEKEGNLDRKIRANLGRKGKMRKKPGLVYEKAFRGIGQEWNFRMAIAEKKLIALSQGR